MEGIEPTASCIGRVANAVGYQRMADFLKLIVLGLCGQEVWEKTSIVQSSISMLFLRQSRRG